MLTQGFGARGFLDFVLGAAILFAASRVATRICILSAPRGAPFVATLFVRFVARHFRLECENPIATHVRGDKMGPHIVSFCSSLDF